MKHDETSGADGRLDPAVGLHDLENVAAFEAWFYSDDTRAHWHCFTPEYKLALAAWLARSALKPNASVEPRSGQETNDE